MTDKKFTDEEIKSSLEVIATTHNCNECKIRNCKWGTCNCSQITANAALDLINLQKAEIERLKRENEILSVNADTAFQDGLNEARDLYATEVENEIKAEAIREFAERLKDKSLTKWDYHEAVDVEEIDNLVKEMVGETE